MFIHYGRTTTGTMKYWWGHYSKRTYIMRVYDYDMNITDCLWIVPGTVENE